MLKLPTATVDLGALRVFRDGAEEHLTAQEGRILEVLADAAGATVARSVLLERALDISPKVVTRALDAAISRLRAKLEPVPRTPVSLLSVRGKGYRLVVAESGDSADGAMEVVLGRAQETQEALELLSQHGCVLLLGPGGIGKTTLAEHLVLRRHGQGGPSRCIDLSRVCSVSELVSTLGLGIGLASEATVDRLRLILEGAENTWIFDNLEQLDEEATTVLRELVESSGAPLILTSRRVPWEGLPSLSLSGLPEAVGAVVMVRAARRSAPETAWNQETLHALVAAVDGLPLALELLGAQLPRLGEATLLASMEEGLLQLSDRRGGRHDSLAVVVSSSWTELSRGARRALGWWSAFRDSFDLEDAQNLLPPGSDSLVSLLDELTRASMVRVQGDSIHIWTAIRTFAADQLGSEERATRDAALRDLLVKRCPAENWHLAEVRLAALPWVLSRRVELGESALHLPPAARARVALTLLIAGHHLPTKQRRNWEGVAREAAAQVGIPSLQVQVVLTELRQVHWDRPAVAALAHIEASASVAAAAPLPLQLQLEYFRCLYLRRCGRLEEALEALELGTERAASCSPSLSARMRQEMGVVNRRLHRLEEAARHLRRALALHRALDEPRFEAGCHISLASIERQHGHDELALDHARRAVALGRRLQQPRMLANALNNLANIQAQRGESAAVEVIKESVRLSRAQGDRPGLCVSVGGLGMFHDMEGDREAAELAYEEARAHAAIAGYEDRVFHWTYRLADLAHRQGRLALAEARYREAIEGLERVGSRHGNRARAMLALLLAEQGNREEADALLARIEGLEAGSEDERLILAMARAGVARWRGEPDAGCFEALGVSQETLQRPLYFTMRAIFGRAPAVVSSAAR